MSATTQPSFPLPYPQPGDVLEGKYQIEKMLGEGGMGAVAKATHLLRRAPVALKFMNPVFLVVPGAVDRFRNEGVAASQIDSDHVVQVYDVGALPTGAPYLVMEYLEGRDLADLLQRDGRPGLPIERAVHFTLQILRGLQIAHHSGIVHRDLKPSNCFIVQKDGEDDFLKLLDFGISKVKTANGSSLTQTNSALGTPLYMSPEQAKSPRDVDARSDIYSVGVLLYELLSGRTPFFSESGEFTEILFKLFTAEPPPIKSARPDLPDGLAAVVHHALARDPANRFQDASQLAEALAPYAGPASAQILTRIRAFTSRIMPSAAGSTGSFSPPAQSIVPPSTAMAAIGQEVLAATQLGATDLKAGKEAQRTDLANTRDATPVTTAAKPKALPVWVVVGPVAAVGLAAVAAFVLFRERPVAPSYDLTPPSSTSPYFAVTPPSAAPSPSAAPVPDSTPSASADPSAKSKPPPIVRPPPSRPPGGCVDQPGKPCIKL